VRGGAQKASRFNNLDFGLEFKNIRADPWSTKQYLKIQNENVIPAAQ
jgi:hypothetical protein